MRPVPVTTAIVAGLFGLLSARAAAMTIEIQPRTWEDVATGSPVVVYLRGEIFRDTPEQVRRALATINDSWISIVIDSPGGNLAAGMELGRLLRKLHSTTTVGTRGEKYKARPGQCFSACSVAYLGGEYRYMADGSVLGVHRASKAGGATAGDLEVGQVIAAQLGAYYREMEVDPALLDLSVRAGPDTIYVLSPQELKTLRVVNNGRKKSVWSIEATGGEMFLQGVQETLYGTGKAAITCRAGRAKMVSSYTAGDQGASIAKGGWFHSVMEGAQTFPVKPLEIENRDGNLLIIFDMPRAAIQNMQTAQTFGHAMQLAPDAPTFVGYQIDIDPNDRQKIAAYAKTCLSQR